MHVLKVVNQLQLKYHMNIHLAMKKVVLFFKYVAGEGYKCTQVEGGIEDVSEENE